MKNGLFITVIALFFSASWALAQQASLQYYRPWDKEGINVFEPSKNAEQPEYTGFKIRVGGSFTQQFQSLTHENNADPAPVSATDTRDKNALWDMGPGFNLATANLNLDFQIEDGIRVALENYMSSRHHQEFWVKGGYVQIDKLPMFGSPDWYTDHVRVKIGHFQPNFGDQQFRRTDNGNAIWNPFVGNYIMDAFTTEIGGEAYVFAGDFMGMLGLTAGGINGGIDEPAAGLKRSPSIYLKLAYDKQINPDFRFRLSGSFLNNSNTLRNTIYGGDRTGSRYYMAMGPAIIRDRATGTYVNASYANAAFNARFNPGFTNKVMSFQVSPFIQFGGLELFATYERASGQAFGRNSAGDYDPDVKDDTSVQQIEAEVVYRFLASKNLYVAARYNQVSGDDIEGTGNSASIDRLAFSAGWFVTKNMLLKAEYVQQNYNDWEKSNINSEGKFNGFMVEAVIGF
ncbi:MAG: hypothetical protein EP344_18265 [Bacteroidetes bacterium]|nr:MAG: hypothetical protein EP344_18265 [Bacteroidota bacterium]